MLLIIITLQTTQDQNLMSKLVINKEIENGFFYFQVWIFFNLTITLGKPMFAYMQKCDS